MQGLRISGSHGTIEFTARKMEFCENEKASEYLAVFSQK
jgi:hypothetical protein